MVDRKPSFLVLQLCLVLVSVIITVRNSKLAGAYGEHAKRKLQYQADSSGFINIDCGASESYTDKQTGLFYESDVIHTKYIDAGKNHEINPNFSYTFHQQQRYNLRSFPEGTRNCYTLKPNQGGNKNYLIRAVIEYGNYDSKNQIPGFDLYLGVNKWATVSSADDVAMYEIIHVPSDAYIDVCLVNTGNGVPYISALELRPLDNSLYRIPNGALQNIYSYDLCGKSDTRYPEDVFDRYWGSYNDEDWKVMSIESNIQISDDGNNYKVPDQLLKTAATPKNASVPLSLGWNNFEDSASVGYIYFHFANLFDDELSREMMIELEGVRNISDPVVLEYLKPKTINSTGFPISGKDVSFKIYAAEESDLPPILNAVEVFLFIALPDSPTNFNDGKHEGKNASILSWEDRMRIAVDAAQGLEYLHDGCSLTTQITFIDV
ncbi:hypothetical protein Q3G72_019531 [Acer saccharum]|nr:hypothetical protein Q3G72_019531 [Acer saccharum]